MISFSDTQHITVENLQENFSDGKMTWCESSRYVRGAVNQSDVDDKKLALTFENDGQKLVEVLEPLTFYSRDGVLYLLNGNNRVTALFQMLSATESKGYDYKPVPYRILESEPSDAVLEELQIVSNDTTTAHSPHQLAQRVAKTAAKLEEDIKTRDPKIKKSALNSKVLESLCNIYKRQHHYIRNLLRVAEQPESVQQLLEKDLVSANTVVEIAKKLPKDADNEQIDKVYAELLELSGGNKITEKHLNDWVESKKPVVEPGEKPTTATPTPAKPVTIEDFTASSIDRFNKLSVIDGSTIEPKMKPQVSTVVKNGLSLLANTFDIFSDDDSLALLEDVRALIFKRLGDIDNVVKRCETAGEEIPNIAAKFKSFNKSVDVLYKAVTEPKTDQAEVTVIETEDMEAEIQALS